MRTLSDTMARLSALREAAMAGRAPSDSGRLTALADFGSNPGALRAHLYAPASLRDGAALVVVLHGCTQTAAGYDLGAGWSDMADRYGFALLFPEQQRQNNPNLCFNWFTPEDSRRGGGEALSIRQMIAAAIDTCGIDPAKVFVTGLSAGGAMATVMLATYPEIFAGGAIIAGLPYGCAATIPQAFDRMRGHGMPGERELAGLVSAASDHAGPWPTLSIWQGSADVTVNPINADAIVSQWRSRHGATAEPSQVDAVDGYPRRAWRDARGRTVIEAYSITGMGHGTPLDTVGEDGCGVEGPYMLEAGISSTRHICRFWGLAPGEQASERAERRPAMPALVAASPEKAPPLRARPLSPVGTSGLAGVGKVIEDALRAAGLMR